MVHKLNFSNRVTITGVHCTLDAHPLLPSITKPTLFESRDAPTKVMRIPDGQDWPSYLWYGVPPGGSWGKSLYVIEGVVVVTPESDGVMEYIAKNRINVVYPTDAPRKMLRSMSPLSESIDEDGYRRGYEDGYNDALEERG